MPVETTQEKEMVEKALHSMRRADRRTVPAEKVKLFLQMVGDELKRTGALQQAFVDNLVHQLKTGAI